MLRMNNVFSLDMLQLLLYTRCNLYASVCNNAIVYFYHTLTLCILHHELNIKSIEHFSSSNDCMYISLRSSHYPNFQFSISVYYVYTFIS